MSYKCSFDIVGGVFWREILVYVKWVLTRLCSRVRKHYLVVFDYCVSMWASEWPKGGLFIVYLNDMCGWLWNENLLMGWFRKEKKMYTYQLDLCLFTLHTQIYMSWNKYASFTYTSHWELSPYDNVNSMKLAHRFSIFLLNLWPLIRSTFTSKLSIALLNLHSGGERGVLLPHEHYVC